MQAIRIPLALLMFCASTALAVSEVRICHKLKHLSCLEARRSGKQTMIFRKLDESVLEKQTAPDKTFDSILEKLKAMKVREGDVPPLCDNRFFIERDSKRSLDVCLSGANNPTKSEVLKFVRSLKL